MTPELAKTILKETIILFGTDENKEKLLTATAQANAAPEEQRYDKYSHLSIGVS
jgi:hypothetical protein